MTKNIINYFKELSNSGWKIRQLYKGDFIPTFQFEMYITSFGMEWNVKIIEITLYTKETKKSCVIFLNGDIYSNEDEVIEELNRLGIK
jgi:hypothetical protein